jgi:hypothetical protein
MARAPMTRNPILPSPGIASSDFSVSTNPDITYYAIHDNTFIFNLFAVK